MTFSVSNLSAEATPTAVRGAFQKYGTVTRVSLPGDHLKLGLGTGVHRGYAFVVMPDLEEARAALKALDQQTIAESKVSVAVARPQHPPEYIH